MTDCLREARVPLHARDSLPLLLLRGAVVCVYPTWRAAVLQPPPQQQPGGEAAAAAAMLASNQAACKASKLLPFETPTAIALVDNLWTPENDCTTVAMKLKRQVITKKHAAQLQAIYK